MFQLISITTKRKKELIEVLKEDKDSRYLELLRKANHKDTKKKKYLVRAKREVEINI